MLEVTLMAILDEYIMSRVTTALYDYLRAVKDVDIYRNRQK